MEVVLIQSELCCTFLIIIALPVFSDVKLSFLLAARGIDLILDVVFKYFFVVG